MVWLGFGIPITLSLVITGNYQNFWLVWGQCAVAIIGHIILIFNRPFAKRLSLILLNLFALVMTLGWLYGAYGFYPEDRFWSTLTSAPLVSKTVSNQGSQSWNIGTQQNLLWSFEGKLVSGEKDWDWRRSDARFKLERLEDARGVYTRVSAPPRRDNDPHISRNFPLDKSIRGRTFRLSLETKMLTPSPDTNAYIMASGGARFDFPLTREWTLTEGEWTAQGDTNVLRVLLRELDGLQFEVRNLTVYEQFEGNWRDLGSGLGLGLRLRADNPERNLITFSDFDPSDVWQRYSLAVPGDTLNVDAPLETQIILGEGFVMQVRESKLSSPGTLTHRANLILRNVRQKLWFPDANLAGHSIAALGLVFLSIVNSLGLALWGFFCLLVTVFLTGSKTAFLVSLAFGSVFIFLLAKRKATTRPFLLGMLALSLGAGIVVSYGVTFPDINHAQALSRPTIWQVAWNAFLDHPLTGLPQQDFLAYFQMHHPEAPIVAHAHNFWLDFAAKYGLLGLASSLILTYFISAFAWQKARWHGLIFVSGFWVLQLFDYTLLFSGVLFMLILGLNFLSRTPLNSSSQEDSALAPT